MEPARDRRRPRRGHSRSRGPRLGTPGGGQAQQRRPALRDPSPPSEAPGVRSRGFGGFGSSLFGGSGKMRHFEEALDALEKLETPESPAAKTAKTTQAERLGLIATWSAQFGYV